MKLLKKYFIQKTYIEQRQPLNSISINNNNNNIHLSGLSKNKKNIKINTLEKKVL